ncbi:MAG: 3-deoxy-D-manno-octulosonic acid transferase [Burkholderiales bacterium]|nr:3-deoxy-D-manno-octulosonic acid transferase [Phycisphaerae bacterium]
MAINFYDIAYGFGVGISAPVWIVRSKTRKKVLEAFSQRMGHVAPRAGELPAVMIHAVSVGELNAARGLIDQLSAQRPELQFIISTTTRTGYERSQELYGNRPDVTLIHYPLDFSAAVARVLDHVKPSLVILMELELWPNFIAACHRRGIPVVLANGRITLTSFKGYRLGSVVTRRMLGRLAAVCAQDPSYAERFIALGANPEKTTVTGTMKFDTAPASTHVDGVDELARAMNIRSPLWVCGSTGPGEEEIVLRTYRQLLEEFPTLQLVIVPRKPERFDEIASLIERERFPCQRRSNGALTHAEMPGTPVILGDTMGELRKFYALADVVFVGRTLVDLGDKQHGSDMIEPAALGKPTIVGAFTGNFAETMTAFRDASAMIEVATAEDLASQVAALLKNPGKIGARAREVVATHRGATARTLTIINQILT